MAIPRSGRHVVCARVVALLLPVPVDGRRRPVRVRLTRFVVPPSSERLPCEYIALPNRKAIDVQQFEVRAKAGLHPILLYAYFGNDRDPRHLTNGVRDGLACLGIGPPDLKEHTVGLLGAVRSGTYRLPPGYAVSLAPRQPVSVMTHVFNVDGSKPLRAAVQLRIVYGQESSHGV